MKKKILILGATGSIGSSCIDIVRKNPDLFEIAGISAHTKKKELDALCTEFGINNSVLSKIDGEKALLQMIRDTDADIAVNGIAGASGLLPSVAVLDSGKDLALANKETIVMAGSLIQDLAGKHKRHIIPVDSEHSAVFNLIEKFGADSVSEIVLTASGGPFRTMDIQTLADVTPEDALKHPTWNMGAKITIDSASMANKGLEVIEACKLFHLPPEQVQVVIHPQSLVHSFIRTKDGILYAQISKPDMRTPIFSALTWPEIPQSACAPLSLDTFCSLQFEPPRNEAFPMLNLGYLAIRNGNCYPIAYNAANEIAVSAFLQKQISFIQIAEITAGVLEHDWSEKLTSFEAVIANDHTARATALSLLRRITDR